MFLTTELVPQNSIYIIIWIQWPLKIISLVSNLANIVGVETLTSHLTTVSRQPGLPLMAKTHSRCILVTQPLRYST